MGMFVILDNSTYRVISGDDAVTGDGVNDVPAQIALTSGLMIGIPSFFLYFIAAYLMLYRVCQPMNLWHGLLFGLMGVDYVGAAVLFPNWSHIVPLDDGCTLILPVFLLLAIPIDRFFQTVFTRCEKFTMRKRKAA